ncbi:hypothetical protein C8R42DRAFT_724248 [Lentinula raphanica]|nr:hypothetical protein C8R42DRAFT_724248 [Lentinula raphanica]
MALCCGFNTALCCGFHTASLALAVSITQFFLYTWSIGGSTNIMVGTHADSLLAEAVLKGFGAGSTDGFEEMFTTEELTTIWKAAWKDASVPPVDDSSVVYSNREEVCKGAKAPVAVGASRSSPISLQDYFAK